MAATNQQSINTTDQARQDFQYAADVDGLLKNVYIPALNNTTFHATPLMEMFGDFGGEIDFATNKIIKGFKHQGAGGFGPITEGGSFVKGRNQKGFQGTERLKYLNAFISLTGPAARTIKNGEGAYVDAIASGMDDTLKLARMNMERMIGGSGNGVIASFTGGGVSCSGTAQIQTCITSGTTREGGYSPCQWLQDGIRVDVYSDTIGTLSLPTDNYGIVSDVDYVAGTFKLRTYITASDANYAYTPSGTLYLGLKGSYGEVEIDGSHTDSLCLDTNGLTNLVSDGISTGETNYSTIWGLARATYPRSLKSIVKYNGTAVPLDEELLMVYIQDLVNYTQNIPNVLVTDPRSRLKFFSTGAGGVQYDRRFNTQVLDSSFGFRSLGVTIDQYTMMIQSLASLKPGTLFLINTNDFKFAKATNGFEWQEAGGRIFRGYETKDAMFATALNYMNFVCENPRGQLKVTGLSY